MSSLLDLTTVVFVVLNSLTIVILKNHTDTLDVDLVAVALTLSFELSIYFSIAV